jgi:hypothetical protein
MRQDVVNKWILTIYGYFSADYFADVFAPIRERFCRAQSNAIMSFT